MSSKNTLAKRERLTLSQLASYDDILTDALVDHVRISLFALYTAVFAASERLLIQFGAGLLLGYNPEEQIKIQPY